MYLIVLCNLAHSQNLAKVVKQGIPFAWFPMQLYEGTVLVCDVPITLKYIWVSAQDLLHFTFPTIPKFPPEAGRMLLVPDIFTDVRIHLKWNCAPANISFAQTDDRNQMKNVAAAGTLKHKSKSLLTLRRSTTICGGIYSDEFWSNGQWPKTLTLSQSKMLPDTSSFWHLLHLLAECRFF